MSRDLRLCVAWASGFCLVISLGEAAGADLRSTIDQQTVVRTVSVQQEEVAEPAPEAEAASEPEPLMSYEPGMEFGYDEGYCPSCGSEACSCLARTWVGLEYLTWWRSGRYFPALVTTTPNVGVLPNATVLFGATDVADTPQPGGRLTIGHWLDGAQRLGVGGHLVMLAEAPATFSLNSNQAAFFARPFYDASTNNTPTAQAISSNLATPATTGQLDLTSGGEFLAADFFVRGMLYQTCAVRLDMIFGYQFTRIAEDLNINTFTRTGTTGLPSIAVRDTFTTENEYQAGHIGLLGEYRRGNWGVELLAKFGFGNMHQEVSIDGWTKTVDANGNAATRASGLLAQATTNGGLHIQNTFSFMDDVGIKLAYYPTERLKLAAGYSMMYWSSVVRPGDEISLSVDGRLLSSSTAPVGATQPAFAFAPTGYFMHGLNLGLEFQF